MLYSDIDPHFRDPAFSSSALPVVPNALSGSPWFSSGVGSTAAKKLSSPAPMHSYPFSDYIAPPAVRTSDFWSAGPACAPPAASGHTRPVLSPVPDPSVLKNLQTITVSLFQGGLLWHKPGGFNALYAFLPSIRDALSFSPPLDNSLPSVPRVHGVTARPSPLSRCLPGKWERHRRRAQAAAAVDASTRASCAVGSSPAPDAMGCPAPASSTSVGSPPVPPPARGSAN